MNKEHKKFAAVCIIGKPNAGKSTLMNNIIGQKISIVTPKVQTTRSIITGITNVNQCQILFFDTPGIFEPKKKLERAMVKCAWSSLNNADMVLLLIDCTKDLDELTIKIIGRLKENGVKPIFLLNKIDLLPKNIQTHTSIATLRKYAIQNEIENYLQDILPESKIFRVSALTGIGIEELKNYLLANAHSSDWQYEEDDITTLPMRFLAAEITREQLFLGLEEELPYNLTVYTETWDKLDNDTIKINQTILVSKNNYKAMILGKNGHKIKEISTNSRKEIEASLGIKIHLFLFVKVRKEWENSPELYQYMGLK